MRDAKLAYETLKTDIEKRINEANIEYQGTMQKINEQFSKAKSLANAVSVKCWIKLVEAEKIAEDEYKKVELAANEKLSKARDEYIAAYKTAYEKFEKAREQSEENRRKMESKHQEELEKGRQNKENAVKLAKEKAIKAQEEYKNAIKSRLTSTEKEKIKNKLLEDRRIYDEAVELANDEWQKVLDATGINEQFEADLEKAVNELEQAQQKAGLIFQNEITEPKKAVKEATIKKQKAIRRAKAERCNDETVKIMHQANIKYNNIKQNALRKFKKIKAQADEELRNAYAEYTEAMKEANNEIQKANELVDELERKYKVTNTSFNSNGREEEDYEEEDDEVEDDEEENEEE